MQGEFLQESKAICKPKAANGDQGKLQSLRTNLNHTAAEGQEISQEGTSQCRNLQKKSGESEEHCFLIVINSQQGMHS